MKKFNVKKLMVLLLLISPSLLSAQVDRSQAFKDKYTLEQVVVLSRHNIRSPLSTNGSTLSRMTTHQWTDWSAPASELTERGGAIETMLGQYFGKWVINEGLFKRNQIPTADEVNFYANSMQRTMTTAHYFATGFAPAVDIKIDHRFAPSRMDPVFFCCLHKNSPAFQKEALKQIAAMGGKKGIVGINEDLKPSYDILSNVLDLKNSPEGKAGEAFSDYNTQFVFELGQEPNMKGSMKKANSAADALILQYYEEPDANKAAFGHDISLEDWTKIAYIKDVYGDALFAAPIVAVNVAHPLLVYMDDELNAKGRKFTFLCAHDCNIASVNSCLEVESYKLPNAIEQKTPIASKLVFEKWKDASGKEFVAINMVYPSIKQFRNLQLINAKNPPMMISLKLKGLVANSDGLYSFEDVNSRFMKAINAYDDIR